MVNNTLNIEDNSYKKVINKVRNIKQLNFNILKKKLIYLSLKTSFQKFFTHCCKKRTYFFEIKKCGDFNCKICGPIRSNLEIFNTLKGLPDPISENEGHYKEFLNVYGTSTTEEYCPSLLKKKQRNIPEKIVKKVGNSMGFSSRA